MPQLFLSPENQPEGRKAFTFELAAYPGWHVVNDRTLLTSPKAKTGYVSINDVQYDVAGGGTLEVFLRFDDETWNLVKLDNVLYVPTIEKCMLSMDLFVTGVDGITVIGKEKPYLLSRSSVSITQTFKSTKGGHTCNCTVGAFNVAEPNFRLNRAMTTDEIARSLDKSVESLKKDDLGIE